MVLLFGAKRFQQNAWVKSLRFFLVWDAGLPKTLPHVVLESLGCDSYCVTEREANEMLNAAFLPSLRY